MPTRTEPRRFAAAWFGEYRRKVALLAELAGLTGRRADRGTRPRGLGQGLEAAIGQFDLGTTRWSRRCAAPTIC